MTKGESAGLRQKKILNCFSGHLFEKQMRQGGVLFYFYSAKKQMQELFSRNSERYFFKSHALTVISSNIIQVRP